MNQPDRSAVPDEPAPPSSTSRKLPTGIWALGFVSMLMDISSEMIHALLPVYMVAVLGTSTLAVGIIEGIAEATASITKVFSGALSDWLGKRKFLAVLGYGLAALTKPIFPLAASLEWLVAARFVDRLGKGIRGAPRDALVADLAPPEEIIVTASKRDTALADYPAAVTVMRLDDSFAGAPGQHGSDVIVRQLPSVNVVAPAPAPAPAAAPAPAPKGR